MRRVFVMLSCVAGVWAGVGGCQSDIRPLRPMEQVEYWQTPDGVLHPLASTRPAETMAASAPATMAGTEPATEPATVASTGPATGPATQPVARGHVVMRNIDPNETARFVYKADYDNIWKQSMDLLHRMGFLLDRQDYREGVMITQPLLSAQVVEPWRPQQVNLKDALENTINSQRRTVRLKIEPVPGKPEFYEVGVQVIVERVTNPTEQIGGPVFVEGSGFGGNVEALRSDYVPANAPQPQWVTIGHDPDMEKKILKALFKRI
ncbi:MAG TPA: hypothetical protein VH253_01685 [Phycisphaerae bacterium]|nr:hypothetical protein [Phycisphaerae bacterium]